jgi:hypothetical protein
MTTEEFIERMRVKLSDPKANLELRKVRDAFRLVEQGDFLIAFCLVLAEQILEAKS